MGIKHIGNVTNIKNINKYKSDWMIFLICFHVGGRFSKTDCPFFILNSYAIKITFEMILFLGFNRQSIFELLDYWLIRANTLTQPVLHSFLAPVGIPEATYPTCFFCPVLLVAQARKKNASKCEPSAISLPFRAFSS